MTDTTKGADRPDLATIRARWEGDDESRPGLLTIVDHAVEDTRHLLAEVARLKAERDDARRCAPITGTIEALKSQRAEIERLKAGIVEAKIAGDKLADQLRKELGAEKKRCLAAEAKVRRVETTRCWRNEDGKDFMFAEDLRAALGEVPDAI